MMPYVMGEETLIQIFKSNSHQYGRMMQLIEQLWRDSDPSLALTVGPCALFVGMDGSYHELQDKLEQQKEIADKDREIERLK